MAIDHRIGNKVAKNLRREEVTATRLEPYPYIGVVKNNLDPTRSGRLQVWIPDLGGVPDQPQNWHTVSYTSPFMGTTSHRQLYSDAESATNSFNAVAHTYGFWGVPPDIGVEVIVIFVAGDPQKGYWIGCVSPGLSHHMIPALAGSTNLSVETASKGDQKTLISGVPVPVAEFNENNPNLFLNPNFHLNPKPVHEYQYNILKQQGLDRDPIRGAISSSSQRESPSHVFGISTPGRPTNDPASDPAGYLEKLKSASIDQEFYKITTRKGGHTFVMDDGAVLGADQLIRLRTAKGHQIMMHDTTGTMYIAHASGDSWFELTSDGAIKVFSQNGVSIRTEGTLNLHSDTNINIEAGNSIKFRAGGQFKIEAADTTLLNSKLSITSTGVMEVLSSGFNVESKAGISLNATNKMLLNASSILQNTSPPAKVNEVKSMPGINHPDTSFDSTLGVWINKASALNTIVTVAPSHEPYYRPGAAPVYSSDTASSANKIVDTYSGTHDATKNIAGTPAGTLASDKELRVQPSPHAAVGSLTKDQTKALLTQLARSESAVGTTKGVGNGKAGYECINAIGFVGKYQFGYSALIDLGYVKSTVTSNSELNNPNSWTGKDQISSLNDYLAADKVQERNAVDYMQRNYTQLVNDRVITKNDPPETVAGMLQVSWFGAGNAKQWREGKIPDVYQGNPYAEYYQRGKQAITQLAPKVPIIDQG